MLAPHQPSPATKRRQIDQLYDVAILDHRLAATASTRRPPTDRLDVHPQRAADVIDNAASESFHSTLEFELLRKHHFATRAQARTAVAAYIDRYNRTRRHSSCEMHSPIEYEAILTARVAETGRLGNERGVAA